VARACDDDDPSLADAQRARPPTRELTRRETLRRRGASPHEHRRSRADRPGGSARRYSRRFGRSTRWLPSSSPSSASSAPRGGPLRYGVTIIATDRTISVTELAREVEARGLHSLWLPEHTHIPTSRLTPPPTGEAELPEWYK